MTRRIRFSRRLCTGVFACAAALASGTARAGEVPFAQQPPIAPIVDVYSAALADLDGDGDLDALSAGSGTGGVVWHENLGGGGTTWGAHTIAAGSSLCARAADLDGDGDLDVIATASAETRVAWYENAAGNGTTWTARTVGTVAGGVRSLHAADVDGDGDRDVISASQGDDRVAWYENTAGDGSAWTVRTVGLSEADPFSVFSGDVDGDGDTDILSASIGSDTIAWHENTAGNGTAWVTRTIATAVAGAAAVSAADVDRDGDLDVLSASLTDSTIAWYENTTGAGTAWTRRTISQTADGAVSVVAADVDADGDLDAVAAALFAGSVAWYENTAGDGTQWTPRTVETTALFPMDVAVGDVDGDGDLDFVAAAYGNSSLRWYRDEALHETACFVTPPPISTTATGARSVFAADVDGDGDTDALAAATEANTLAWYENAAGDGTVWLPRTITTAAPVAFSIATADLDGDGDQDALTVLLLGDAVLWYENTAGNGSAWTVHTVATGADGPRMAATADVDRDGDADVLAVLDGADALTWYENTAGDGSSWTARTITTALPSPYALTAADVDGDGDADVVGQSNAAGTVAWYENVGAGASWSAHTVTTASSGLMSVSAGDLDHDGDTDLLGGSTLGVVRWYENTAGDGTTWTPRTIHTAADDTRALATVDLDRDGDPDVLSASIFQNNVAWYENASGDASTWAPHLITNDALGSRAVAAADFDGNGQPDALGASDNGNRVAWYTNRGGQFALTAANTAPPGSINGSQVPMLRVIAAHGGRTGDGDLELARFGVRVEEAPGDPYTTAEANAVIEAIRVYRDANGNGVFDLGTDVQVAIVTDLALTNGVQLVGFADGDPGVAVSVGSPRTYFVIAELTADASTHAPNNFRLVHLGLGPAGGAAEDRTYDIPLRPACPADVPSSVVVPITPVELTGFQVE